MSALRTKLVSLILVIVGSAPIAAAQTNSANPKPAASAPLPLGLPKQDGPLVVHAAFALQDINAIDDDAETFQFTGVLTLKWMDKRQAFDPATEGVDEKIYQGNFQFDEISPGWFPQDILVNESGTYEKNGVILRAQPDGTQILVQTVDAVAEVDLKMRRFPFDEHRLEAVFVLLGFSKKEVVLVADPEAIASPVNLARIPQWTIKAVSMETRDHAGAYTGSKGVSSAFVMSVDVKRKPFFIVRLVMLPLAIIVFLSFSVFWMDRSSLGDRINISFIGILTGVAYQFLITGIMPQIDYVTMMHAFLNFSFITMGATVVINLVVGALDRKGRTATGNLIDNRCRWIFPLAYVCLIVFDFTVAFLLY